MPKLAVILTVILTILAPQAALAQALPPIDDSYTSKIIDDSLFTGGFYLTPDRIQEFLETTGEDCDGELCLKDYRDPATKQSAAEIIYATAASLAINPKVILITLQKENSLVTDNDPEPWQYRTAMGYGCPDDADCEADFFGFENQIRLGATLLRVGYDRACGDKISHFKWRVDPRWYRGNTTLINNRPTLLQNCATASLYNYTPHRVDSAWRDVDGQYYYGNYNFVYLLEAWSL